MRYQVVIGNRETVIELQRVSDTTFQGVLNGKTLTADVSMIGAHGLSILLDGRHHLFTIDEAKGDKLRLTSGSRSWEAEIRTGGAGQAMAARQSAKKGRLPIQSPMPGKILKILGQEGDRVKNGDCLAIIEAMKMENELKSPKDGRIVKVEAREGDSVDFGETILIIDDPSS